jgi:hypothetical protein
MSAKDVVEQFLRHQFAVIAHTPFVRQLLVQPVGNGGRLRHPLAHQLKRCAFELFLRLQEIA